jgi:hypothetical protein
MTSPMLGVRYKTHDFPNARREFLQIPPRLRDYSWRDQRAIYEQCLSKFVIIGTETHLTSWKSQGLFSDNSINLDLFLRLVFIVQPCNS